ncbi:MAG: c-type cytochrome [Gemmatimonadales bacterium]
MTGARGSTVAILILSAVAGCGGERRSGAVSGDSAGTPAMDSGSARTGDTASVAVPRSSAAGPRDTTPAAPAAAPKPQPPKPAPKPAGAKPAASKPAVAATPAETSGTVTPPESTSAAPAQTSDAGAPLRDEYHRAPLDTVSQEVYNGWKQFNLNCARCHGEDVQGTTIAPHLIVSLRPEGPINTKEVFVQTVCAGRPAKGMPSWCALGLGMDKINEIYSYVKGRSDSKIHAGRPAVKAGG